MVPAFLCALTAESMLWCQESYQRVGDIDIVRVNIFNPAIPEENKRPYTWVNKLHLVTRESVVRRELLLSPGEPCDPYLLANTERNLRSYAFIKDADIRPIPRSDGFIDLDVRVQDTWTTDISPSFGMIAGRQKSGMLLRERNFLGYGKTLELRYTDEYNRISRDVSLYDPRLLGSRFALRLKHSDHSGGYDSQVSVSLPVYSLVTPLSMETSWGLGSSRESLYHLGEEAGTYLNDYQSYEVSLGRPIFGTSRRALRGTYGFELTDHQFSSSTITSLPSPESRRLSMIKAHWNYQEADYINENRINQFDRREDFSLGLEATLRLAYSARALGAASDEFLPYGEWRKGFLLRPGSFILASAYLYGIYTGAGFREVVKAVQMTYYRRRFFDERNTLVVHAEASMGERLEAGSQILLGGNNGLRGYRYNAFDGNRSALLNMETRFHLIEDWLRVVSAAPVLFWNAGYVWPLGAALRGSDLKQDIGLGCRLGFTRSATSPTVRFDLARALNREGAPESRWIFSIAVSQAFESGYNTLSKVSME